MPRKWITAALCNPWTVVCSPTSIISRRCSSALAALPLCNHCWHHRWVLATSSFSMPQEWFSSRCQCQHSSSSSHSSQWWWQRNNSSIWATMSTSLPIQAASSSSKWYHLERSWLALPTRMHKQRTKRLKRRRALIQTTSIRHLEQYSEKTMATRLRYH